METLLSIEGMAETAMLPSYMNEDGFLPVSLLLNLISTSLPSLSVDTVIEAVQGSDKVVVDGEDDPSCYSRGEKDHHFT